MRTTLRDDATNFGHVDAEIGGPLSFDHRCTGNAGDVPVQLIRRFEGGDRASGPGEGEENRLQHFVAAVGDEDLIRTDSVQGADRRAKGGGRTIGISVPLNARHFGRQCLTKRRRRSDRSLVRVQTNIDGDLGRVVSLQSRQIVANGYSGHEV